MSLIAVLILACVILIIVATGTRRIDPFTGLVIIIGLVILWYVFAGGITTRP